MIRHRTQDVRRRTQDERQKYTSLKLGLIPGKPQTKLARLFKEAVNFFGPGRKKKTESADVPEKKSSVVSPQKTIETLHMAEMAGTNTATEILSGLKVRTRNWYS